MTMWITLSSLPEQVVTERTLTSTWNPMVKFPPKSEYRIKLPYGLFNRPEDLFFDEECCCSLASYLVTRFDIIDDVYYLGRLRFFMNIIERDLKRIKQGKRLKLLPISGYCVSFENGAKELIEMKTQWPDSFESLVKHLDAIRVSLIRQMQEGKGDNYIVVEYSS